MSPSYFCPMRILPLLILLIFSLSSRAQRMSTTVFGGPDNPNETTVAINPSEPRMRVAAANIDHFYYSAALGLWHQTTATSPLGVYGDPVLHYIGDQLYYAHLSKTDGKEWGDWFDRIVVQRIIEVKPWQEESFSVGFNEGKMQDKPWLSNDWTNGSYSGNLYVGWTEFDKYGSKNPLHRSRIRFAYLSPGAEQFSEAITISDTTGDCADSDNTLEGVSTAVGKNGRVYAVWAGHNSIYFDKSSDGGQSWSKDKIIASQIKGWDMEMPHIMRANGMPFLAVDTVTDGLFLCWADERNGKSEVWLKYSRNKGETWSKPINISRDSSRHAYFPNMVFDPVHGGVQIIFFDQSSSSTELYYQVRVVGYNPDLSNPYFMDEWLAEDLIALPGQRFFYGDYIDLDVQSDLRIYSYPQYENLKSSVALVEIKGDRPIKSEPKPQARINVTADLDSIYLSILNAENHKIKCKIILSQKGVKQKLKIKKKFMELGEKEAVLGSLGLYPDNPLFLKIKYKMVHPESKEVFKAVLTKLYP